MIILSDYLFHILIIIVFAIRLIAVRHTSVNFDTYGHLYFAKEVKEQKAGPFGEFIPNVIGATSFRHPFLWHWLVGFFNIESVLRHQKWINPVIDALFTLLIYMVVLYMGHSGYLAFQTAMLYLLTPIWFSSISIGPRLNSLTPRLASEVGANLFFMVILLPLGLPGWLVILFGTLLGTFVLLTSKFGLQVMLFLAPLTALIALNPMPLIALILSLLFALSVTRGQYAQTVSYQINHLTWYFRKNLKGEMVISNRNSWSTLSQNFHKKRGVVQKVKSLIGKMLTSNSYTLVLIKMPVLTAVFLLYAFVLMQVEGFSYYTILAPVIAAFVVYMLINRPMLLFLGEAERYLNHVAFFIVFACVVLANNLNAQWIIWLLVAYGLMFWFVENFTAIKPDSTAVEAEKQKFIKFLSSLEKPGVVLAYPYHAGGGVYRIMLETPHKVIEATMVSGEYKEKFERKYAADYPFVRLDALDEMAEEMGVNILVVDQIALGNRGNENWAPSDRWLPVDIGADQLFVYIHNTMVRS